MSGITRSDVLTLARYTQLSGVVAEGGDNERAHCRITGRRAYINAKRRAPRRSIKTAPAFIALRRGLAPGDTPGAASMNNGADGNEGGERAEGSGGGGVVGAPYCRPGALQLTRGARSIGWSAVRAALAVRVYINRADRPATRSAWASFRPGSIAHQL